MRDVRDLPESDYFDFLKTDPSLAVVMRGTSTALSMFDEIDFVESVPEGFVVLRCESGPRAGLDIPWVVVKSGPTYVEFPMIDGPLAGTDLEKSYEMMNALAKGIDVDPNLIDFQVFSCSFTALAMLKAELGTDIDAEAVSHFYAGTNNDEPCMISVSRSKNDSEWIMLKSPLTFDGSSFSNFEAGWQDATISGSVKFEIGEVDPGAETIEVVVHESQSHYIFQVPDSALDVFLQCAERMGWAGDFQTQIEEPEQDSEHVAAPEDIRFVAANCYSNPFWSMSERQIRNPELIEMAKLARQSRIASKRKAKFFWIGGIAAISPAVISFFEDMNHTTVDEYGNVYEQGDLTALTFFLFLASMVLVVILLFQWLSFSGKADDLASRIRQVSVAEYRSWMEFLRRSDPTFYAEIVRWEQEQQQLMVQRQMLATAQAQLRETERMRNELNQIQKHLDPRRPRVDGDKY